MQASARTGYPSKDRPWLQHFSAEALRAPLPKGSVADYLWQCNKEYLSETALSYFDRKITFGALFEHIRAAERGFAALGVQRGEIVTFCTVSIPETVYAFYGLNRLGAIANMTDPRTSVEGLREYISEVKSTVLVCLDVVWPKLVKAIEGTAVRKIVILSPADSLPQPKKAIFQLLKPARLPADARIVRWQEMLRHGAAAKASSGQGAAEACCVIEHTGGTTGTPKGVMLSNRNVNALAHQYAYGMETERQQTFLDIMPPFIAYGIAVGMHMPLCCGNTVILIPQFDPNEFPKLMRKYHPTHFCGVPTHFDPLIKSPKMRDFDLSFMVNAGVGGDQMDNATEQKINKWLSAHKCKYKVAKGYGMTETSSCACSCSCLNNTTNKLGSVGVPMLGNVVAVFDPESGQELPYGQVGELCMQGPTVMMGYYDRPEETAQIIRSHADGQVWLHSGDLGTMDEDGCVFIKGRLKRLIIRHDGFKVFPSMIENVVTSCAGVMACSAIGVRDKAHSQGKLPMVYVVAQPGCDAQDVMERLHKLCQSELPEYAQPVGFRLIPKLPVTPIGKVDFLTLEKMAETGE